MQCWLQQIWLPVGVEDGVHWEGAAGDEEAARLPIEIKPKVNLRWYLGQIVAFIEKDVEIIKIKLLKVSDLLFVYS